jgi:hypothetical protein
MVAGHSDGVIPITRRQETGPFLPSDEDRVDNTIFKWESHPEPTPYSHRSSVKVTPVGGTAAGLVGR